MKADDSKEYLYAVVKFLELPGADVGDYVCIPRSWIQMRTGRKITVAYPSEQPSITKKRIKAGENPLRNWKCYMAVVKFEAYTYKKAMKFIMEKKCNTPTSGVCPSVIDNATKNNCSTKRARQTERNVKKLKVADKDEVAESSLGCERGVREPSRTVQDPFASLRNLFPDFPGPLGIQLPPGFPNRVLSLITKMPSQHNQISTCSPVRQDDAQVLPNRDVSIDQSLAAGRTNYAPKQNAISAKQNESSQLDDGRDSQRDLDVQSRFVDGTSEASMELDDQSPGSESSADASYPEDAGQATGSTIEDRSLTIDKAATGDVSSTQDADDDEDDDDNGSSTPGVSTEETLGGNQQADQLIESVMNSRADQLIKLLKIMKVDFSRSSDTAYEMHKSFARTVKMIELIEKASNSIRLEEINKIALVRPNKRIADVKKVAENQDSDLDEGDEDEGESSNNVRNEGQDGNENKDKGASSRTCEFPRSFVLPPEYDPNDSRWTLKYHNKDSAPSLVELVPESNVFVDSIQLSHCKRVAKDSKALARLLLAEIFRESALSVCSLTGARANAFYNDESDVRPGLDENARVVMLSYVEDYTKEKKWGPYNGQRVINSLRSRLQEMRYRRFKTK
ncbi:uncharacterized protein LOC133523348 [Cydia pomonella]|uniref:uncharacterized protein LOC133523348 n=1 Tax=Cydia pomonella TaxID=82600 RepID=UPI002ADD7DEC|nr:uncharacterized protein LOC133523348 [Cydia pomonella]